MEEPRRPPVILLGMHRSGTSLVTRALMELGLFLGHRRDENDEALFFLHLNEWLLAQAGASWENPEPFESLLADEEARELAVRCLERFLGSARLTDYLGIRGMIRYRKLARLDRPWGFKDPRNALTLPLWLEVFPPARVVHILRNGVDVARSLLVRRKRQIEETRAWLDEAPEAGRGPRWNFRRVADTVRLGTLDEGFALWETYLRRADAHLASVPEERRTSFRYEDFVLDPRPHLERLGEFAGLPADREAVERICGELRPGRVEAWKRDEDLVAFHEKVRDRASMRDCGY